ncbi:MAG: CpsB/CapC family capsule biosynthesis tyrosine phosphatase [Myxococcota bacterium]
MIDLHCHLAYGVDDGAQTQSDSIALALALEQAGVTHVACTSHFRRDRAWMNNASVQKQIHSKLDALLGDKGPIRIKGAEHYLDELLLESCRSKQAVPYELNGKQSSWILLELPYQTPPPKLMDVLFRIQTTGYKILLAHLERFPYVYAYPEKVEALRNAGCLIQVNLGSLAGAYGKEYQLAAEKLLKGGQVDVLAGDCHHADDVGRFIVEGLKAAKGLIGGADLRRLTVDNPSEIVGL